MIRTPIIAGALFALILPVGAGAQSSQSQVNYGVLLYSQQNYALARSIFASIDTAEAKVWLARTMLQQENYRQAVDTAQAARDTGLPPEQETIARRVQIAAIRLGGLQAAYANLASDLGIKTERPWQLVFGTDLAVVTGLLREFDNNGNAVRDDDLRLSLSATGTYKLPWRPGGFQPVVGYRLTHRHFFENQGFIQQNHQPFASLSRRVNERLSIAFRYDHTTSLSGSGLDLFLRQNGVGASAIWRLQDGSSLRGDYALSYSNFNNSDDDDNITNALSVAWTRRDSDAPLNTISLGGRAALVSAESQVSAHSVLSLFAARDMRVFDDYRLRVQAVLGHARFNQDDPTDNRRRKDTTLAISGSAERELAHDITVSASVSVSRVISTIDRIDRTSAIVGVGVRKKF